VIVVRMMHDHTEHHSISWCPKWKDRPSNATRILFSDARTTRSPVAIVRIEPDKQSAEMDPRNFR